MIRIQLNGHSKALDEPLTVERLMGLLKINSSMIAVAVNYDVLPRSEFPSKKIKDGDKIDILKPTQGG